MAVKFEDVDFMDIVGTEQDLIDATEDIELSQIALEVEEESQLSQAAAAAKTMKQFVLDAATAGEANQPNFDFGEFDMSFLGNTDNSDSTNNRFSAVVSNEEITNVISEQKNKIAEKNTKWAMNVFNEWQGRRRRRNPLVVRSVRNLNGHNATIYNILLCL
ncbi:unnamed protein product [Mytilus coruscus]|uniref:Uncharacterized protein n=1 Tax=Mytilus coruscus TaxID=42192 RepID=A0A6J8BQP5_MYTCO|nr:unnamed protein product [Mytilus coruscus]